MDKISVIVSCPIDTYSGYGARSRDFVKALLKNSKYDVKILAQRWGNTPFGYLEDHNEDELTSLIIPQVTSKPDIWIQVTVPNEFQKIGKYNIGLTAGIETTICDASWIEGCNRMDLVLTSSVHSKNVFLSTKYTENDQAGNVLRELKLTTPVEVLFEGVDLTKYFKSTSTFNLDSIKEQFCFLFVGTWLQGDYGQDRKNIGFTVKSFLETFKNKQDQPALILKTGLGTSSYMNTDIMLRKIDSIRKTVKGKLPNIYIIDGDLTDEEMNNLYNNPKIKAMVSFTKGEGFGRPLLEFSLTGKPIVASNWSGHLDFLDKEFVHLVGGTLTKVHKSAASKGMILEDASWFTPDDAEVGKAYRSIIKNYKQHSELGKRQGFKAKTDFNMDKMSEVLHTILDRVLPEFPKQVELKLPTLTLPKFKV